MTETETEPAAVELHLHRGIGWGLYGTATVVVLGLVLVGAVTNVQDGRYLMAAVIAVVGLGVAAFLGVITSSLVLPALTVSAAGIRGRTPRGRTVDAGWDEITIDVGDEAPPATLLLGLDGEPVTVNGRSWVGFGEFVVLVASTRRAAVRLTPAARQEVTRLLQLPR